MYKMRRGVKLARLGIRVTRRKKHIRKLTKKVLLHCAIVGVLCISGVYIVKTLSVFLVNDKKVETKEEIKKIEFKTEESFKEPFVEEKENPKNTKEELLNKDTKKESLNYEYLELVNKENSLSVDYKPTDLIKPDILFLKGSSNRLVRKEVGKALEDMFDDAYKQEGIVLLGVSGYRSYDYQSKLYSNSVRRNGKKYANKYVAKAGKSEHQLGLAIDVVSDEYTVLNDGFRNTDAYKWLVKNMHKYGFILRYPKGKEDVTGYNYESWHLRYVGVKAAKDIKEKGMVLEEYVKSKG